MTRILRHFALIAVCACLSGCIAIAAPDTIERRAADADRPPAAREIRLVTWNIGKQDVDNAEIRQLVDAHAPDILCLQEATANTCRQFKPETVTCCFAPSWEMPRRNLFTGVLTLSRFALKCPRKILSPDREFIFLTPKAALISMIPVSDGRTLMIINVHSLNFRGMDELGRQYDAIYAHARRHAGPMILCGDFNTWNGSRMKAAQQLAASLEMVEALAYHRSGGTPSDWFLLMEPFLEIDLDAPLDRIFFRGFERLECRWLNEFASSDHPPLFFRGRLLP